MVLTSLMDLALGSVIVAILAILCYKKKALTNDGIFAAIGVGMTILFLGGLPLFSVLLCFFLTATLLTKFKLNLKRDLSEKFQKGYKRDGVQVLANGIVSIFMAILMTLFPEAKELFLAGFIGAIATVNADTWSTELGVLSSKPPRMITNGKVVEAGTSGAISLLGEIATIAGALCIGLVAYVFIGRGNPSLVESLWILVVALIGGFTGSAIDSLMGATIQGIYYCDRCKKETEKKVHGCGAKTRHLRGFEFIDNDVVNALSSLGGAIIAILIYILM
ncbi:MAG: DUF92 domain-containing protein [Candidatus Asgardarchaeia archaeon]